MTILHFTLGPVQSFVKQARRTRDLWAGSFLLSYLSAQAMKAVLDEGGNIVVPKVGTKSKPQDPLLRAILKQDHLNPQIGSLPNHFKAEVDQCFDPITCQDAIQRAWESIAEAVWQKFVQPIAHYGQDYGQETEQIWKSQVKHFWEIVWVKGDSQDDHTWLNQRKHWHTHTTPEQNGDYCTLMGDLKELSGYVRTKAASRRDKFWREMRDQQHLPNLDLGEYERLCAIALIKRLYPRIAEKKQVIGWPLAVKNWPSTSYMAAVPWIQKACQTQEAEDYRRAIEKAKREGIYSEYNSGLSCLMEAGQFAKLDGGFFHQATLENKQKLDLAEEDRPALIEALNTLNKAVGKPASSFYALLLMDGDRVGAMLQSSESPGQNQEEISKALSEFTGDVEDIVKAHCGKTIYAGGDDVLALLPLNRAIEAAIKLRQRYRKAFSQRPDATISAAIVFAHYHLSLRGVLKEAHHLLDDIAKDQNGRDSVAISVLSNSGRTIQWVSTWENCDQSQIVPQQLLDLREDFAEAVFSSRFVYNIRARFAPLLNEKQQLIAGLSALDLLIAEYQKSREQPAELSETRELVKKLLFVCRKRIRQERTDGSFKNREDSRSLVVDGALLVRFLTQQEINRENV